MGSQGALHTLPDGTQLPRVTSILDAISKPALVNWAARLEREHVVSVVDSIIAQGGSLTAASLLSNLGAFAHEMEVGEANAIGSAVHKRIEWLLMRELGHVMGPKPFLTGSGLVAYNAWRRWRTTVDLKPIFIEQRVWSRRYGYAGTMDLFCTMTLPGVGTVHALPDWKTSKRIYGEAGLQNAAYAEALVEMGHAPVGTDAIHGVIVRLPKDESHPDAEVEIKVFPPETHALRFARFLAAFEIFRFQREETSNFKPVELPAPTRPVPTGDEFAFA